MKFCEKDPNQSFNVPPISSIKELSLFYTWKKRKNKEKTEGKIKQNKQRQRLETQLLEAERIEKES